MATQPTQNFSNHENSQFSAPASQANSNPFTGDLKGEFNSNFGTNTNAVSQIFKEGGFVGQDRTKYIAIGAAVLLLLGAGLYYYMSANDDANYEDAVPSNDLATNEAPTDEIANGEDNFASESEEGASESATTESASGESATDTTADTLTADKAASETLATGTGTISLVSPTNGASRSYDEASEGATFEWQGIDSGFLLLSRSPNMAPVERRIAVSGNSYSFSNPYPGTWYWRIEDGSGSFSDVFSFSVQTPERINFVIAQPASGGSIMGNGGTVSWQGSRRVAYYRVEFSSSGSWATPNYVFSTSGTTLNTQNMTAGSYEMRVGGFSEISGQWEYSQPMSVVVQ